MTASGGDEHSGMWLRTWAGSMVENNGRTREACIEGWMRFAQSGFTSIGGVPPWIHLPFSDEGSPAEAEAYELAVERHMIRRR